MTSGADAPPLDPSSEQAQEWVREELARGGYTTDVSWWQRFVEWLRGLLQGPAGPGLPPWVVVLGILVVLAVVALVVLVVVRSESRAGTRPAGATGLDDEGLGAAGYRRRAEVAATRQDWDALLLDSYRALAASAVERTLLVELPGRTAHEAAMELGAVFPGHGDALATAANSFDDVRYGHRAATEAGARAVADLDATLLRARPRLGEPVAT